MEEGDEIIERIRNRNKPRKHDGKVPIGVLRAIDEKLTKEHRYDMDNVCPKCRIVKSKRGECMC